MAPRAQTWLARSRSLALGSLLIGCTNDSGTASGGSGDWDAGPFTVGLPASTTFTSLDSHGVVALCAALDGALRRLSNCSSFGMAAAYNLAFDESYGDGGELASDRRLRLACSETRRQCEASLSSNTSAGARSECVASLEGPARCSGTVQQFEACVNDTLTLVRDLSASTPRCEELRCATFPDQAKQWLERSYATAMVVLPACQAFLDTCPSVEASLLPPAGVASPIETPEVLMCGD